MTYAYTHTRTVKAGGDTTRRRGEVEIYDDSETYFYESRYIDDRRAFKRWIRSVFAHNDGDCRVVGAWPSYSIEHNRG
jgi:hypothetical protein